MKYDVAIIGAGISGCCSAYFLHQAGLKVLLLDKVGIAAGGSGAAGAFISPKIEKTGDINTLSQSAFVFSLNFYKTYFSHYLSLSKLTHINASHSSTIMESGLLHAQNVCHALVEGITFEKKEILSLESIPAQTIIIATGAYKPLMPKPYLSLRPIFGHRIDITTTTAINNHFHEAVSIAQSVNNKTSIGATHNVHMSFSDLDTYDVKVGHKILLEKAAQTLKLDNINIINDYYGFRSGSSDYMPHLGAYVDEDASIRKYPQMKNGRHYEDLIYHKNIYTLNGMGGYGFVLAPYLANELSQHIMSEKAINKAYSIDRFFRRWVKKC